MLNPKGFRSKAADPLIRSAAERTPSYFVSLYLCI